jgi:hypothetical protein
MKIKQGITHEGLPNRRWSTNRWLGKSGTHAGSACAASGTGAHARSIFEFPRLDDSGR